MKNFLTVLICLLCGCQPSRTEKSAQPLLPQNWSGHRPDEAHLLPESDYLSAAMKHAAAKIGADKIPASPTIKLFYPDVLPEKQAEFPLVLAHVLLKRVEGKEFNTVTLVAVYMNSDTSLIEAEQTELNERISSKHGAPW